MPTSMLIVGCGYLGRRVADAWLAEGAVVYATTRGRVAELAAAGLRPIVGDLCEAHAFRGQLPEVDTVLYCPSPDRRTAPSPKQFYRDGLANILAALPPCRRFIHISSTSVYGQTDGSWVNEDSPCEPSEQTGQLLRDAEQELLRQRPEAALILRFAGIYGPGRLLREQAIRAGQPLIGDADKWLNLIHVADGVLAVLRACRYNGPYTCFNISDGQPVTRREFYTHLAQLLQAPPAQFERPSQPTASEANRRISNRRAVEELGFQPKFPSYLEGLAASVGG